MGQAYLLIFTAQYHLMIADYRTAAQGGKTDGPGRARCANAVAPAFFCIVQINATALRRRRAQKQSRARRRIDFVAVMQIDNFNIPCIAQLGCRLAHQAGQHIDAEAHIARFDNARMARRRGDLRFLVSVKAGRADNMDKTRLGRQCGQLNTGGGCGEVNHPIGLAH